MSRIGNESETLTVWSTGVDVDCTLTAPARYQTAHLSTVWIHDSQLNSPIRWVSLCTRRIAQVSDVLSIGATMWKPVDSPIVSQLLYFRAILAHPINLRMPRLPAWLR